MILIVRFVSSYHGHISGVDAFDMSTADMVYLRELDETALEFIEKYHYCIELHTIPFGESCPVGKWLEIEYLWCLQILVIGRWLDLLAYC